MAARSTALSRLKEIGISAAVECALFLSGVLTVFSPLPVILAYRRGGLRQAIAVTILATGLIFGVSVISEDPATMTLSLLSSGTMLTLLTCLGLQIGYGMKRNWNFSRLMLRPITTLSGVMLIGGVLFYTVGHQGSHNVMGDLERLADLVKAQAASLMNNLPENSRDSVPEAILALQQSDSKQLALNLLEQFPLFAFWGICIVTWIVVHSGIYYQLVREWKATGQKPMTLMADHEGRLSGADVPKALLPWIRLWKETFFWRLPDTYIFAVITTGVLAILPATAPAKAVGMLLFKISGTFYAFQGMSLIRFSMEYFRIPSLLRMAIYFSIFLVPGTIGFFILMGVGILDFWADFRKRSLKGELV